jgi:hypothetical protein
VPKEVEKPKDWNDHIGWEKYYSFLHETGDYLEECQWTGSISMDRLREFVGGLKQRQLETIWIPGCGVSVARPYHLGNRGFYRSSWLSYCDIVLYAEQISSLQGKTQCRYSQEARERRSFGSSDNRAQQGAGNRS